MSSSSFIAVLIFDFIFVILAIGILIGKYCYLYTKSCNGSYAANADENDGIKCCCCVCSKECQGCLDWCGKLGNNCPNRLGETCVSTFTDRHKGCWKITAYIFYDVVSIIMGFCYLLGDNFPEDYCRSMCDQSMFDTKTCNFKQSSCNPVTCKRTDACDVSACRIVSLAFLGISTVLNLSLLYLENTSFYIKDFPIIGKHHMKWNATTNLLTLIVFFDQTLSGFYESAFKFTRDEQLLCSAGTHVAGSLIHATSIAVWTFFLVVHYFRYHPEDGKQKIVFITTLVLLFVSFVLYIFVDVPWPWECIEVIKEQQLGGLIARLVFLVVSLILILIIAVICCFVWYEYARFFHIL